MLDVLDDGVEAVVLVGGVLHDAPAAVRFNNGVLALDGVAVTRLPLGLNVVRVQVVHRVVVVVVLARLGKGRKIITISHETLYDARDK